MATDLSFFRSESAQLLRAQGRAEGLEQDIQQGLKKGLEQRFERGIELGIARCIIRALRNHGIEVSAEDERTITSCHDRHQLDEWLSSSIDLVHAKNRLFHSWTASAK